MSDIRSPTVVIADGVAMPLVGLGTWQASDQEAYDAVGTALDLGYRLIDTATMYRNEVAVGRAVRDRRRARGGVRHHQAALRRCRARAADNSRQS